MSSDTLIKVDGVSKKFCLSLKKSLWYGLCDMGRELTGRRHGSVEESQAPSSESQIAPPESSAFAASPATADKQVSGLKSQVSPSGLRPKEFWAVHDVSFELKRSECLGLIGRNGAGKTTLLKMLNGLIKPDAGRIEMRGRVGALIALGAGFNPILTGRENIYVNGSVLGLTKREIDAKLDEIVDFAEIDDFIDTPVQNYSSGMSVRLGFAVASSFQPDILLLDEVLAVGDSNFQAKCFRRVGDNLVNSAVILVSHNAYHIKKMCDRVVYLEHGKMIADGDTFPVMSLYQEKNVIVDAEKLSVLGDEVASAAISCKRPFIKEGESLSLILKLDFKQAVCDVNNCFLNLADAGGVVCAQCYLADLAGDYLAGKHVTQIDVGPLHLASGRYFGNLIIAQSGGKRTLAHLRGAFSFDHEGPMSMGPVYYPPVASRRMSELT